MSADAASTPAQTQFAQGLQLADKGDLDGALAVFTRLTRDYPRLPEPYAQLAAIHVRQGEPLKAIAPLQTAVQLDRDTPALQEQLGDLYIALAKDAYAAASTRDTAQTKAALLQQLDIPSQNKNTHR
jgi:tetratricopeptide (TPR) repeat protein